MIRGYLYGTTHEELSFAIGHPYGFEVELLDVIKQEKMFAWLVYT